MKKLLLSLFLACLSLVPGLASAQLTAAACHGRLFNPVTDPDWNYIYPITIMGVRTGGQSGVPYHYVPPVCVCPGPFGIPSVGIGLTYWEPKYISEIERTPGCLSTLGGINVLGDAFAKLQSEGTAAAESGERAANRRQVHWYTYPVYEMLSVFMDVACKSSEGFNLAWLTEIDYFWQDDAWGLVLNPEAALFSNPIAQLACSVDCVASSAAYPLDSLFWCAGCWGSAYPLTGNGNTGNSDFQRNNLVQAKFLARQHRLGLMFQTIGPSAICSSHINPIWVKSQYRVNQIGPVPLRGSKPTTVGDAAVLSFGATGTSGNLPTREHTQNLIWQAIQCCARLY